MGFQNTVLGHFDASNICSKMSKAQFIHHFSSSSASGANFAHVQVIRSAGAPATAWQAAPSLARTISPTVSTDFASVSDSQNLWRTATGHHSLRSKL